MQALLALRIHRIVLLLKKWCCIEKQYKPKYTELLKIQLEVLKMFVLLKNGI